MAGSIVGPWRVSMYTGARRARGGGWHVLDADGMPLLTSEAGRGSPVGGKGSQERAKESETFTTSTVRSSIRRPSYTTIAYMQRA